MHWLKDIEIKNYLNRPPSREEGPLVADKMRTIPDEMEEMFDVTLELAGIKVQKH